MSIRILIAVLLLGSSTFAQPLQWANGFGGGDSDGIFSTLVDDQYNVYVTGFFRDTVDFDPGPGTNVLISAGDVDGFVMKLNPFGQLIWVIQIGGTGGDSGHYLAIDSSGGIYVSGYFSNSVDFDPGPNAANMTSNGGWDGFILKLNQSGEYQWVVQLGNNIFEHVPEIAIDSKHDILACGFFQDSVDFDPGPGVYKMGATGGAQGYVWKLDSSGAFIWARKFQALGTCNAKAITVDADDNVYVGGYFSDSLDMDPGIATDFADGTPGSVDHFYVKLTPAGDYVWGAAAGGPSFDNIDALKADQFGNVYATGRFSDSVDFDPGPGTHFLQASGSHDAYLLKLDTAGNLVWVHQFSGAGLSEGLAIDFDSVGSVHSTGYFTGTVDFDPGTGTAAMTAAGYAGYYVVMDSGGNYISAGIIDGNDNELAREIYVDEYSNVYIVGTSEGTADHDPGAPTYNIISNGKADAFVLKLSICDPFDTVAASSCGPYNSPSGNYVWTSSGTYQDTLPGAAGCDTFLTINLTLNSVDTTVTVASGTLTANDTSASYQWIYCDSILLPNDTNQSFTPVMSGNFAVVLSKNGCIDTSRCHFVLVTATGDADLPNVKVFPNPSQEQFQIKSLEIIREIHLLDGYGRRVQSIEIGARTTQVNWNECKPGVYLLQLIFDHSQRLMKIVHH